MVSKTVTYLGVSLLQEDMPMSNFISSDADGLVFSPSNTDQPVEAEAYVTYHPTEDPNPLWNAVEIDWTRWGKNLNSGMGTTFTLYGITPLGDVVEVGSQLRYNYTTTPTTEKIIFDLLHSACGANMSLTTALAPANEISLQLPKVYGEYKSITYSTMLPEPVQTKMQSLMVTGSPDGNNINFAIGPIYVPYDADMNVDFGDVRWWYIDYSVQSGRYIPVPSTIVHKVNGAGAFFFIELPVLAQNGNYWPIITYGKSPQVPYKLISPYTKRNNNYMGQLHLHTGNSDGVVSGVYPTGTPKPVADVATTYDNLGYDWLAPSDHNTITPNPGNTDLLWIPCEEWTESVPQYNRIHLCVCGAVTPIPGTPNSPAALAAESAAQKTARIDNANENVQIGCNRGLADGAFVQLNHPTWLETIGDSVMNVSGYHAVAIYNSVNGTSYEDTIDTMLCSTRKFLLGIEDDTHNYSYGDAGAVLPANAMNGTETTGDTTGFTAWTSGGGSATITSDTTSYHTGSRSLKCVTGGGAASEGVFVAPTVNAFWAYTAHFWVNAPLGASMELNKWDAVNGNVIQTFTGTGNWQHVSVSFVPGNTTPSILVCTNGAQAVTFNVDDVLCYSSMTQGNTAYHVYADNLTQDEILENLKLGNYYLTRGGNDFVLTATNDGTSITATVNQGATIEFITNAGVRPQINVGVMSATYTPNINDAYVRVKATRGTDGANAWTNPIWIVGA